jgi:hypothetical protein
MMRRALFLLLFLSFSFAMFGQSRLGIERTWTITGDGPVDFKGALAVNDSNQHIVSFELTPGVETITDSSGTLWVRYRGPVNESEMEVRGTAVVEINYATNITSDQGIPSGQVKPSELTGSLIRGPPLQL